MSDKFKKLREISLQCEWLQHQFEIYADSMNEILAMSKQMTAQSSLNSPLLRHARGHCWLPPFPPPCPRPLRDPQNPPNPRSPPIPNASSSACPTFSRQISELKQARERRRQGCLGQLSRSGVVRTRPVDRAHSIKTRQLANWSRLFPNTRDSYRY